MIILPKFKDTEHRRAWIIYQLKLKGLNLAKVAKELGINRNAPQRMFYVPYPRVERAIAKILGLKPEEIWPERYGPDGCSNRKLGRKPIIRKHYSTLKTPRKNKLRGDS